MKTIKCPQCGSTIPSDVNYCPYCGTELKKLRNVSAKSLSPKVLRRAYSSISLTFLNQFMLTATLALLILIITIVHYLLNIFTNPTYFIMAIGVITIAHLLLSFINVMKFMKIKKKFKKLLFRVQKE